MDRSSKAEHLVESLAQAILLGDDSPEFWRGTLPKFDDLIALAPTAHARDSADAARARIAEALRQTPPNLSGLKPIILETVSALQTLLCPEQQSKASAGRFDPTETALIREFVNEASEHLESAELNLLALETNPGNQESLNGIFRSFHTIKGVSACLELKDIAKLAHAAEDLLERVRRDQVGLGTTGISTLLDVIDALKQLVAGVTEVSATGPRSAHPVPVTSLIRRLGDAALTAEPASARADAGSTPPKPKLGAILIQTGTAAPNALPEALQQQRRDSGRLGEQLAGEARTLSRDVVPALPEQQGTPSGKTSSRDFLKVDADRLDRLLEMIGELVITESMVARAPELSRSAISPQLTRHVGQLDKITRELQDVATSLRMVPIRAVFQKMARLVRDLAHRTGKNVELLTSGEETELDKSVVEHIADPLVHMIRNAIDHGIEALAERRSAGKAAAGKIQLRAYHRGGSIYIEIEDDGRGLDREAILAKARDRKLVRDNEALSDREIHNLIFLPGFSTAETVSDLSGRGVGLDVVKRNIDALRGQAEICSERGKGCVFTIRLPLTLAVINGMVVSVGSERYILPTLSVVRSVRPQCRDLTSVLGQGEVLKLGEQLLPVFRLHRLFKVPGAIQDATQAVVCVVEDESQRAGLLVDGLIGQQQVVLKSLGETMRGISGVSGGAIMPDGQVGLILDVSGLVRLAHAGQTQGGGTSQVA
ncbi:MAG TPA: chemotaxis protein CheA [Planctomycetota bacterium]